MAPAGAEVVGELDEDEDTDRGWEYWSSSLSLSWGGLGRCCWEEEGGKGLLLLPGWEEGRTKNSSGIPAPLREVPGAGYR